MINLFTNGKEPGPVSKSEHSTEETLDDVKVVGSLQASLISHSRLINSGNQENLDVSIVSATKENLESNL